METKKFGTGQSIDELSNEELPRTMHEFDEWLEGTERMKSLYKELSDLDIDPKSDLYNMTKEMISDTTKEIISDICEAKEEDMKEKIKHFDKIMTVIEKILEFQSKEMGKFSDRILHQPKK